MDLIKNKKVLVKVFFKKYPIYFLLETLSDYKKEELIIKCTFPTALMKIQIKICNSSIIQNFPVKYVILRLQVTYYY